MTSFAQRYGRSGAFWREHPELPYRPITDWEVWNEANLIGYWDGRPSPRSYAKLLRLTAQALRATDPAAKVIVSGLFPHPPRGFGPTMARFIRGLYRVRGIKKDFDAIAIHPFSPRPAGVLRIMLEAKRAIAKHRDKARMWVTEVGWATSGAGLAGSRLGASESGQAKRLRQSFRLLLKNRKRLRLDGILWHIWRDVDGPGEEPWTQRMGLLRSDGTAKPAFGAFSAFARG